MGKNACFSETQTRSLKQVNLTKASIETSVEIDHNPKGPWDNCSLFAIAVFRKHVPLKEKTVFVNKDKNILGRFENLK